MIDSNRLASEDLEEGGAGALELAELEVHPSLFRLSYGWNPPM